MKADTLRGHLDAMILSVIESGPLHGYGVAEALEQRSGGAVNLPTGTLYPALRRLERHGYLKSSWSAVNGRKRRTYELTSSGAAALAADRREWVEISRVLGDLLRPTS